MRSGVIALLRGTSVAVGVGAACLLASLLLVSPPTDPVLRACFYLLPLLAGCVASGAWCLAGDRHTDLPGELGSAPPDS